MEEVEIIESIKEWPVTDREKNEDPSSLLHIDNPSSVSAFFLRNVRKQNKNEKKVEKVVVKDEAYIPEVLADAALAKWWRKEGKSLHADFKLPESKNPTTILSYISRYQPGIDFLKGEVQRLRQKIEDGFRSADVHAALASCYDRLGNLSAAKMHLETAIDKAPEDSSYQWLMQKVKRQTEVRRVQEQALSKLNVNTKTQSSLTMPASKQVDRVSGRDLSFEDFFYKYELTSTPVIITDVVAKMTSEPWTLEHIKEKTSDDSAMLKKVVPHSAEWARLEDCTSMKVSDFVQDLISTTDARDTDRADEMYLFDWSLPLHCPDLAKELTIPKYFSGDFLQRTSSGSLYQDSWPSLFIAPAGLRSELHIDAFGSNFWMALFQGQKRWVFFNKEDTPLLYPHYNHSMDPVFDVDLSSPDLSIHPLLSLTQPLECVLQPGELLFVPAGCPHRVENLEKSVAISGNYVDLSNVDHVKQELSISALNDPRSADLLNQLTSQDFKCNMFSCVQDLPWDLYKSQTHPGHADYNITPEMIMKHSFVEDKT